MAPRPLCRYCGKPIPKRTHTVMFHAGTSTDYWTYIDDKPRNKAEAQRLVNEVIVSVRRHHADHGVISSVSTWDGESYIDPYFCNGSHAKDFAYMIAKARPMLGSEDWASAIEKRAAKEKV